MQRKNDKEFVLKAVTQNGYSLNTGYLIKKLFYEQNNTKEETIVKKVVKINGLTLKHVRGKLNHDKEVILIAMKQEGIQVYNAKEIDDMSREEILKLKNIFTTTIKVFKN
jgi:hypothetical protein